MGSENFKQLKEKLIEEQSRYTANEYINIILKENTRQDTRRSIWEKRQAKRADIAPGKKI